MSKEKLLENVEYEIEDGVLLSFVTEEENIEIPSIIDGQEVKEIALMAIDALNAKTLIFPETCEVIEDCNIPDSVEIVDLSKTKIKEIQIDSVNSLKAIKLNKDFSIDAIKKLKKYLGSEVDLITDSENNFFKDKYGAIYSPDKKVLISGPTKAVKKYEVQKETIEISERAFAGKEFEVLDLKNVQIINNGALQNAKIGILLANSVLTTGNAALNGANIQELNMEAITYTEKGVFSQAYFGTVNFKNLSTICEESFFDTQIENLVCPETLRVIQTHAFSGDSAQILHISFNEGLKIIEKEAFETSLADCDIIIPKSLELLDANAITYSENAVYCIPKIREYRNGIKFNEDTKEAYNIFCNISKADFYAYYSDTNLEKVQIVLKEDFEAMLADDLEMSGDINKLNDSLKNVNNAFINMER